MKNTGKSLVIRALIIIGVIAVSGFQALFAITYNTDSLLRVLDKAIENHSQYIANKRQSLKDMRRQINEEPNDLNRFNLMGPLIDEYTSFSTDSAFTICKEREDLATRMGEPELITQARMNTANLLGLIGMYKESLEIIDSINFKTLPEFLHPFYFHINRTVYGFMADYAIRKEEKQKYTKLTNTYRDSLVAVNQEGSLYHTLILGDKLNVDGHPEKSVKLITDYLEQHAEAEPHAEALLSYTLSESYRILNQRELQKQQLIISAIADMKTATLEYVSLRKLAIMLYEDGDIKHAYAYLKQCMEDATMCNARLRQIEINNIFPVVNNIYLDTINEQQRRLKNNLLFISLLSLALLIAFIVALLQTKRAHKARLQVAEANAKLLEMNNELKDLIDKLRLTNAELSETSRLKEEYIGSYMDQCSLYLEKLDSYRKRLNKMLSAGHVDDFKALLKSTSLIDDELKAFYEHFDQTFLRLFPTFVEDFNALLADGEEITPKSEGRLNTELRIFALIRLGITDSTKIAEFLRYSVTTIYNYRTRIRNKAKNDRNALEKDLMDIGSDTKS